MGNVHNFKPRKRRYQPNRPRRRRFGMGTARLVILGAAFLFASGTAYWLVHLDH